MASVNSVVLIGNVTRTPEIRQVGQTQVAEFGLAMNERWTDRQGETKESVTFVDVKAWGKQADAIGQYVEKGRQVCVQGRLKQETWEDKKTGEKRSKLTIDAQRVTFLGQGGGKGPAEDDDTGNF